MFDYTDAGEAARAASDTVRRQPVYFSQPGEPPWPTRGFYPSLSGAQPPWGSALVPQNSGPLGELPNGIGQVLQALVAGRRARGRKRPRVLRSASGQPSCGT